jgi:Mrp family chromosome partitioning ATPase
VLAIDTDLEGQVMTLLLHRRTDGVPQWRGLADVLEGIELADALQPIPVAAEGRLDLLAGGSGAATLRHNLDGEELAGLIGEVRDDYDVVVVDVPPLLNVAYAAHVLSALDHVVVVASAGCSARELADVRDRLAFLGVSTSGFLHNRGPLRPERTASVAALHYDLGGRTTARRRHSALRQRQLVPQVGRLAGLIRRRKRALNPSRAERPVAQGAKTDARGPVRQQDRGQTRV